MKNQIGELFRKLGGEVTLGRWIQIPHASIAEAGLPSFKKSQQKSHL